MFHNELKSSYFEKKFFKKVLNVLESEKMK